MSGDPATSVRGIGDNNPPGPLAGVNPERLIDPSIIADLLEHSYPDLPQRKAEVVSGVERWIAEHTPAGSPFPVLVDDADAGSASDRRAIIASFAGAKGEAEEVRQRVKRPVFEAGKIIDAWFNDRLRTEPLELDAVLEAALGRYRRERAARIEAARREEARRAAEDARRLAEQAERARSEAMREELLARAVQAEQDAMTAAAAAANPVRTILRSDLGVSSHSRSTWKMRVTDIRKAAAAAARGDIPAMWLTLNETVANAAAKGKNGLRNHNLPADCGLEVYEETKEVTRTP